MPNEEQIQMLSYFLNGKSIALFGPPGTGKTYVSNLACEINKRVHNKKFVRTATTGMASTHLADDNKTGKTVYNWLNTGAESMIGHTPDFLNKMRKSEKCKKALCDADILQIDEASMLNQMTFGNIENAAREIRKKRTYMGGIQTILSGDIMQLGTIDVAQGGGNMRDLTHIAIPGVLDNLPGAFEVIMLKKLMRSGDELHQEIMKGIVSEDVQICSRAIKILNEICCKEELDSREAIQKSSDTGSTIITYANSTVDTYNEIERKRLASRYPDGPIPIGIARKLHGWDTLPQDAKNYLENEKGLAREEEEIVDRRSFVYKLSLYPNQLCMLRRNTKDYKNGQTCIFKDVIRNDDGEVVAILVVRCSDKKELTVEKAQHTSEWVNEVGYEQFPIIPNAAVTVHKIQGSTLDGIIFDPAYLEFSGKDAPRLLYTAISRTKSLKGITLTNHINPTIFTKQVVRDEMNKLCELEYMADYPKTTLVKLNSLFEEWKQENSA